MPKKASMALLGEAQTEKNFWLNAHFVKTTDYPLLY